MAAATTADPSATVVAAAVNDPTPLPNNAILDPVRKLFRLRKSSGGTIAKGAFGIFISTEVTAASGSAPVVVAGGGLYQVGRNPQLSSTVR